MTVRSTLDIHPLAHLGRDPDEAARWAASGETTELVGSREPAPPIAGETWAIGTVEVLREPGEER